MRTLIYTVFATMLISVTSFAQNTNSDLGQVADNENWSACCGGELADNMAQCQQWAKGKAELITGISADEKKKGTTGE